MGPLVPFGVIGPEFNLIVAFFLGIAFGYILEQAGFSTSKKLVGVFYGYDFVVLRVFFTAAVTAVIGLLLLNYFGGIDLSYVYVNPTFLWSGIVGGAIMGLGFILGGFCPGTSVVAASTGKTDAMFFILGSFIGIFIFGEVFPLIKDFYYSASYGAIYVYDSLGLSRELFALLLTVIAIAAFIITDRIEKRVSYGYSPNHPKYNKPRLAVASGVILALIVFILPNEKENVLEMGSEELEECFEKECMYVTVDRVAYDIYYKNDKFIFIDLRDKEEYEKYCLPGAVNMKVEGMDGYRSEKFFEGLIKTPVFYSEGDELAKRAFVIARDEIPQKCFILKGGLERFKKLIYETPKTRTAGYIGDNTYDFRLRVREYLQSDSTLTKPPKKKKVETKVIEVQGGC